VYPTQYSKIVIEVTYCACPTSEFNGWVIFVGKKSNYGLSQNCLRDRRTLGMFFFFTFLLSLSCFLMSFFTFLLFLFPLLHPPFFALFSRSPFCPFSPVLHSFMLSSSPYTISLSLSLSPVPHSCPPPSFPFFHSITTLSAPHMYHFHSIIIFFVSFDISYYKYYLICY
jgi:hypothetical protein